MNLGKLQTLARLAARGDWQTVRKRWFINQGMRRARRYNGRPFVHREMGFPAVCHPDWIESLDQYCNLLGYTETAGDAWEFGLVRAWLRPGDAAIDAGTNLGLYSFAIADRVGSQGRILSVDADITIAGKLQLSATLLQASQISPLHGAVSDKSGTLTFYIRTDRSTTADQSLIPEEGLTAACTPVVTPAYTFPNLLQKLDRTGDLTLVKIDIEGAEALALRTVPAELLGSAAPLWLVEINPGVLGRFGSSAREVIDYFSPAHFERWLVPKHPLPDAGKCTGIRLLGPDESFRDSLYYNLIALPLASRWAERCSALQRFRPAAA